MIRSGGGRRFDVDDQLPPPAYRSRSPTEIAGIITFRRMRFSTSSLFVVSTIIALGIWCYLPLSVPRFFAASPIVGAITVLGTRSRRPPITAATAGFLFVLLPVAAHWTYLWLDYVFYYDHNQQRQYFEDGTIAEGVLYPIIYCVIYGTLASLMACASGLLVARAIRFVGDRNICRDSDDVSRGGNVIPLHCGEPSDATESR